MKIKTLPFVFLSLLLISGRGFSQGEGEKLRIHVAPLNLLDPITGVLQVGIQKNLNEHFALSLDHGFKMQTFKYLVLDKGIDRKNLKYSKTKVELKYFTGGQGEETLTRYLPYLSIEGIYFPQEYTKEDEYLYRNQNSYQYTYSDIKRPVWIASLKYGKEIRYDKIVIDSYIGLGVRQVSIEHEPFALVEKEYYVPADWDLQPLDRNEGVFYRAHVSLGVKLGYRIK